MTVTTNKPVVYWYDPVRGGLSRGETIAIVVRGRTTLHAVLLDAPVTLKKVPLTEERHMRPITHKGHEYKPARAARIGLKQGRAHGITKNAKSLLKSIVEEARA